MTSVDHSSPRASIGRKKIVFVGASYKFVHRVFRDMILVGGFQDCEIALLDIDEVPLKTVGDLCERMARQRKTNVTITRTLDRPSALKDADIVVLSITVGGRESDMRSFEVCAKYEIPVGVGDTLGPAALARNLRTIPVIRQLVRDMEALCPKALLLNFTNPMSCLTGAAARMGSIPTYGLCHSADGLAEYFSTIFHCPMSQVDMEIGGVNHQAFLTRLRIAGVDRTGDILATSVKEASATVKDQLLGHEEDVSLQQDVYRVLGVWPSTGHTHLAEFYPFFFTPRRIDHIRPGLKAIMPGRAALGRMEPNPLLLKWAYGTEPVGDLDLMTNEHAHELMWTWLTGEPYTRVVNVLNSGEYLTGVPKDACVEVSATIAGRSMTAKPVTLPTAALSWVQRWTAVHDLTIRAAVDCDRAAAMQALMLDPHVTDLYDIAPMLEDFLTALEPWMPRGWYRS
ncbi:MAG: hypothetical protein H0W83_15920 [Planctomycetes bacterium]|nr:hypothetical protein [Planctomycetota bacterium]